MPYQAVRSAMNVYAKRTGLRAVLVQHGVNDNGRPEEEFFTQFKFLVEHTRKEFEMLRLAFVLVNDEVPGERFQPQRNAFQRLFGLPNVYRGFDFKRIVETTERRDDRVHLKLKKDFVLYADLMNAALTDDFFRKAAPYVVKSSAPLTASE
jgi:hypothetical protein